MFQIGLIRHPPVNVPKGLCYGHSDVPLQESWQDYAVLPNGFHVDHIFSSPALRCFDLTREFAKRYQISYQSDARLLEFDFGEWEGKLWDHLPKELIDEWAKDPWGWQIPGGENGQALLKRVTEVWDEIKQLRQNILIVSHGGPLRLLRQIVQNQQVELLGPLPDFGALEIFNFYD
ncbi:histidine phosphatase family protein [Commensalibacter oyaizuii]|uniref:Histidine phosphatase family protein n=1 Tax=Commensalibacter oyaizuii TaxID=3043873 RepID=A0ABT6Q371_9PROT|nr:histidine phosphatase family protein [Commensalibacter sp. TBRC 16381]MDI2090944.1 histidine phosphatase family protein [Commensalibacter sp. TBRC 16381]